MAGKIYSKAIVLANVPRVNAGVFLRQASCQEMALTRLRPLFEAFYTRKTLRQWVLGTSPVEVKAFSTRSGGADTGEGEAGHLH